MDLLIVFALTRRINNYTSCLFLTPGSLLFALNEKKYIKLTIENNKYFSDD